MRDKEWSAAAAAIASQLPRADVERLPHAARLALTSSGMAAIPHLPAFFADRALVQINRFQTRPLADAVIGWGHRPSGQLARRLAVRWRVPLAIIEDGFIRSVGLGKSGCPPVSIVLDDGGIYFDAAIPSRLERLLATTGDWLSADLRAQAERGLERWRLERLSKYNLGRDVGPREDEPKCIILVDQVAGDASVPGALASQATFAAMLTAALDRYAASRLVVRAHPDVVAGKARGYLTDMARRRGIPLLADDLAPHAVLDGAEAIWTVSSGFGFEALLRGIPVTTFGVPFFAGYGLTDDHAKAPAARAALARRGDKLSAHDLFAATFLAYARYADPITQRALTFEGACDRLVDWRRRAGELAAGKTYAFGFSRWKHQAAQGFLGAPLAPVRFQGRAGHGALQAALHSGAERVAVWGITDPPGFEALARAGGGTFVRVEDGFLRSVGLGSDIRPASSLVLDDLGIYYDATRPSRLEALISEGDFNPDICARAARLRTRLITGAVTKYNLGSATGHALPDSGGRPIALVVEQVPGDAALKLGTGRITTNDALLAAVRRARPDAFVIYKEHPDLVSGNRAGRRSRAALLAHADHVVSEGDLARLYGQVDEVHVLSSLAGFEALVRGVPVVVWGMPFYGGWGLTEDHETFERRTRRVTLDELVAATLILYPRYADPLSGVPCSVEAFVDALERLRAAGQASPAEAGPMRAVLRQLGRLRRKLGM